MRNEWHIAFGALDHLNQSIVPFFDKHPLKSKKRVDFVKFRKILLLMRKREHLAIAGIAKIRAIAATMNTGVKDKVQLLWKQSERY